MRRFHGQEGFTLVELMVSALVLVVGMLGLVSILGTGYGKTTLTADRVAATNLAREITETARQVSYTTLTPASLVSSIVGGASDLGTISGSTWTVKRRNTTYTVRASVCAYDDPADQIAADPPENRCADNPGGTTGDANGDDFRRVTVELDWTVGAEMQTFKQSTLIVNPSGGLGPRILTFTGPAATITWGDNAHFDLTSTWAETIHWNADDGKSEGDAAMVGTSHKSWTIDWALGAAGAAGSVLDGTYTLIAQAFDERGIAGDAKVATVSLNRSLPFAPANLAGGHNTRIAGDPFVDFEWSLNPERDIVGYRLYWAGADKAVGGGDDLRVCPPVPSTPDLMPSSQTSCVVKNPPAGSQVYFMRALDQDTPIGPSPREGDPATIVVPGAGSRPQAPVNLVASGVDAPLLTWSAPATGQVAFYRIYRDGTGLEHRIGSTGDREFSDPGVNDGQPHTYYVSSVNAAFNESDLTAVTWSPSP